MPPVREISKLSEIHSEDLYRVLQTLQTLGLIAKVITHPVTFIAVPLRDALSFLHRRKISEIRELKAEEKKLLQASMTKLGLQPRVEEEAEFVLIPAKEAVVNRRRRAITDAQTSIDVINSWKRHFSYVVVYAEHLSKALKRGVKIRLVTRKLDNEGPMPKALLHLLQKPNFKLRYIPDSPSALVSIYDRKAVLIVTDETAEQGKSPALWSNNRSLVALAQNYFKTLQLTSTE
jgi:sugar-specific transcriptional regulator TrmB